MSDTKTGITALELAIALYEGTDPQLFAVTIHFTGGNTRYNCAGITTLTGWANRYGVTLSLDAAIPFASWDEAGPVARVEIEEVAS